MKKIKRVMAAGLAALGLMSAACAPARAIRAEETLPEIVPPVVLTPQQKLGEEIKSLYAQAPPRQSREEVEREIGKWEPWILDALGNVRIKTQDFLTLKLGGAYNPVTKEIIIPYLSRDSLIQSFFLFESEDFKNPFEYVDIIGNERAVLEEAFQKESYENVPLKILTRYRDSIQRKIKLFSEVRRETIDSIDHELSHALLDDPRHGILFSPEYSGPSLDDLVAGIKKDLKSDSRRKVYAESLIAYELKDLIRTAIGATEGYVPSYSDPADLAYVLVARTAFQKDPLAEEVLQRTLEGLLQHYQNQETLRKKDLTITNILQHPLKPLLLLQQEQKEVTIGENFPDWKRFVDDLGFFTDTPETEEFLLQVSSRGLADFYKEVSSPDYLKRFESEFELQGTRTQEGHLFQQVMERMPDGDKGIDWSKEAMRKGKYKVELYKHKSRPGIYARRMIYQKQFGSKEEVSKLAIFHLTEEIPTLSQEDVALRSMLKEILARKVDSLLSVHVGEESMNKYRLTTEELDFFSQMTYQGRPMFSKAVQKYRLALKLVEEGMEPKRVQETLEYATSFKHKGREYFFPELDFPQKLQLMFTSSIDKGY